MDPQTAPHPQIPVPEPIQQETFITKFQRLITNIDFTLEVKDLPPPASDITQLIKQQNADFNQLTQQLRQQYTTSGNLPHQPNP